MGPPNSARSRARREIAEAPITAIADAQSADAMTCLQAIYTDESVKPEVRAAAAKAALAYQRPKVSVQALAARASRNGGNRSKLVAPKPVTHSIVPG